jgi:hypothetical protein
MRQTRTGMAVLCLVVALLTGAAAAIGVFLRGEGTTESVVSPRGEVYEMVTDGIYRYNAQRLVAEGVGWDLFTLFAAVPALLVALLGVSRDRLRWKLFALGILAYLFYQYLMYAVTWAFGPLFLLFVGIYAGALAAILWILSTIRVKELPERFSDRFPGLGMGVFSLAIGLVLTGMWLGRIIPATAGQIQGVLVGQTTLVVQALDLGLIVPLAVFTGVMAWRRRPLGYLLASVLVVKGAAMAAAISAMLLVAWSVEGTLEIAPLAFFVLVVAAAVWLGVRMYRSVSSPLMPTAGG